MKLPILYLAILFHLPFCANSQTWQWSHQIGSNWWDVSGNVVSDANGNTYSAGIFKGGYCYFPGDTSNIVNGDSDFYLIKLNSNGVLEWWSQIGGSNGVNCSEGVASMGMDHNGNLLVAGSYCGTVNFGNITLLSSGTQDGFVAKYDNAGNCLWAKNVVSFLKEDAISGVTVDGDGNVYVCGTNNGAASIGGFTIPPGGFIAKFDSAGNCLWAKNKMGYATLFSNNFCTASPQSIKFSNNRLTVSGGITNDTITIDTLTLYTLIPNSDHGYLAQFDTSANVKWVRIFSGPAAYYPNFEHAIDQFGNTYVTGTSTGQGYFQTDILVGPYTAFIVKFDSLGTEQWVKGITSTQGSWGNMVSSDGDGNVYLTGRFRGNTWFGSYNLVSGTNNDMFVARYNSSGDCLGVRAFGEAEGFGVTQDNNGNAYVCGNFSNTITIGGDTYTTYGDKDIFIAKLDQLVGVGDTSESQNQLLIYANPNQGKCNITIPDEFANENHLVLRVFDQSGKLIQEQKLQRSDGKIRLNLEAEAKGTYHVTLSNQKKSYHGKIIFQ